MLDNTLIKNLRGKGVYGEDNATETGDAGCYVACQRRQKMADIQDDMLRVAKNIVWLNLLGNNFSDADLAALKQMVNLEKLRLDNNPVCDAVVADLTGLKHLEAVNLNETNITQAGLNALTQNVLIKRVYSWKPGQK